MLRTYLTKEQIELMVTDLYLEPTDFSWEGDNAGQTKKLSCCVFLIFKSCFEFASVHAVLLSSYCIPVMSTKCNQSIKTPNHFSKTWS